MSIRLLYNVLCCYVVLLRMHSVYTYAVKGMFALFALSTPELPERKLTQRLPERA